MGPVARGAGAWSGSCTWRSDWWGFSWRNCPSHVSAAARRRRQAARLHRRSPDDAPPRGIRNRHAWRPSARASRQRPAACQSPFAGCVPRAACRVSPRAAAAAGSLAWRAPRGAVGRRVLSIPARPASARCALGPSGRGLQAVAAVPTGDYSSADGSAPSAGPGRQAASGTAGDRPVIRDRWPLIAPGARWPHDDTDYETGRRASRRQQRAPHGGSARRAGCGTAPPAWRWPHAASGAVRRADGCGERTAALSAVLRCGACCMAACCMQADSLHQHQTAGSRQHVAAPAPVPSQWGLSGAARQGAAPVSGPPGLPSPCSAPPVAATITITINPRRRPR